MTCFLCVLSFSVLFSHFEGKQIIQWDNITLVIKLNKAQKSAVTCKWKQVCWLLTYLLWLEHLGIPHPHIIHFHSSTSKKSINDYSTTCLNDFKSKSCGEVRLCFCHEGYLHPYSFILNKCGSVLHGLFGREVLSAHLSLDWKWYSS